MTAASIVALTWSESSGGRAYGRRLPRSYARAVREAGGRPIVLEAHRCADWLDKRGRSRDREGYRSLLVELAVGAVVVPGGGDVGMGDPVHLRGVDLARDRHEIELVLAALDLGLPVLGICRGAQVLNVALGGSLLPDIPSCVEGAIAHEPRRTAGAGPRGAGALRGETAWAYHMIQPVRGTTLARLCGEEPFEANSWHHQAVDRPGKGLAVSGRSLDGVVEAIERAQAIERADDVEAAGWCRDRVPDPLVIGVQWHPERLVDSADPVRRRTSRALFSELVRRAGRQAVGACKAGSAASWQGRGLNWQCC